MAALCRFYPIPRKWFVRQMLYVIEPPVMEWALIKPLKIDQNISKLSIDSGICDSHQIENHPILAGIPFEGFDRESPLPSPRYFQAELGFEFEAHQFRLFQYCTVHPPIRENSVHFWDFHFRMSYRWCCIHKLTCAVPFSHVSVKRGISNPIEKRSWALTSHHFVYILLQTILDNQP